MTLPFIALVLALGAEVQPPVLLEDVAAEYPAEAAEERREAVVVLMLTLDTEGKVTDVTIVEPAGFGFDEAAQRAARLLKFAPATLEDKPVAVQFLYRWQFSLAPLAKARAVVRGLASMHVTAHLADDHRRELDADDAGVVMFEDLPSGLTSFRAEAGDARGQAEATLEAGTETEIVIALNVPDAGHATSNETIVRSRSLVQKLRGSAEAVTVLDTTVAKQRSSDMGELLARTQGVTVRRSGGLGSAATFSLNGLEGDQIRMFLDGVPLELVGYPFGLWNVPVNLVQRVEIYRGVVPIRFGTDALGGAVNLISDAKPVTSAAASYQVGSFGTHRVTLAGTVAQNDWSLHAEGFFDRALNDYFVDVDVADSTGQQSEARVKRFHDAYTAGGGSAEFKLRNQPWVRSLSVRVFGSAYGKELQNNPVMTVPYGEVRYGEIVTGVTARSEHVLLDSLTLETLFSYSHRQIHFEDRSQFVYDWFGQKIRTQDIAGEIDSAPHDQYVWDNTGLARLRLDWHPFEAHTFRLAVTPTVVRRTGDETLDSAPGVRDPLNAQRGLFTMVTGLEHQLDVLPFSDDDKRLQNVVFAKHYLYSGQSGEIVAPGVINPIAWASNSFGVGDALRVHATEWLTFKASYEYATRLPRPDEVFGNGVLIRENLALEPEVSHNANVGPRFDLRAPRLGSLIVEANVFLRDSDRLIVLLGQTMFLQYQNVRRARALGTEGQLAWSSPGEWVNLQSSFTWQDLRNISPEGTFGRYDGDRVPNRPWLYGSWGASVRWKHVFADDMVEPFYAGRYVHEFYRTWESVGLASTKQITPAQITHAVGVTYSISLPFGRISVTGEVQNLTDARVYDVFGVQRPGRAFYAKVTGELK